MTSLTYRIVAKVPVGHKKSTQKGVSSSSGVHISGSSTFPVIEVSWVKDQVRYLARVTGVEIVRMEELKV